MKKCGNCKKEKSLDDFNNKGLGKQSNCKTCNIVYQKIHYKR